MMLKQSGFSLLEMIIVVALIGVLAAFAGPPVTVWNCKRALSLEFSSAYDMLTVARSQAPLLGKSLMVSSQRVSQGSRLFWGESNRACSVVPSEHLGAIELSRSTLTLASPICFHRDSTASGTTIELAKSCGGVEYTYRAELTTATGYLSKQRRVGSTGSWEGI